MGDWIQTRIGMEMANAVLHAGHALQEHLDGRPEKQFIELHDLALGTPITVNSERIDFIVPSGEGSEVTINGTAVIVREPPEEIGRKLRRR